MRVHFSLPRPRGDATQLCLGPERASGFAFAHSLTYVTVLFSLGSLTRRLGQQASYALGACSMAGGLLAMVLESWCS